MMMKFSKQVLVGVLAAVAVVRGSGPADGEAAADPNSAVERLTGETFKSFIEENPLVLAEFFAPWCGYCKMLGPEYSSAADSLKETHPDIKLAQIDCTEESDLCAEYGIRGYPTLKVFRGLESSPEDYQGGRDASAIADYMIKQSLPAVQSPEDYEALEALIDAQEKPFVIQIAASDEHSKVFDNVAQEHRNDYTFISVAEGLVDQLKKKFTKANLSKAKSKYLVAHPNAFDDVREFAKDITIENLKDFVLAEVIPYFGDINRDTFLQYMSSPLPLAYYFYDSDEQREEVSGEFNKLGKEYKGKINFVGLDARLYGAHADSLNMDGEHIPLFAIQDVKNNKKFGISQEENPKGPSIKQIKKFVKDYFADKLTPIIKSEPLPTEEEKASEPVVKLVAHNYDEYLKDTSKDVIVKYYAPWCGHCKKLAPTWDELAAIYDSNKPESQVIVAKIDHTANDVTTPVNIEGYPTILLYPANGEIDEETGYRQPITFQDKRTLESFVDFIKESGYHKVDGHALKEKKEKSAAEEATEEATEEVTEEKESEEIVHDEL